MAQSLESGVYMSKWPDAHIVEMELRVAILEDDLKSTRTRFLLLEGEILGVKFALNHARVIAGIEANAVEKSATHE